MGFYLSICVAAVFAWMWPSGSVVHRLLTPYVIACAFSFAWYHLRQLRPPRDHLQEAFEEKLGRLPVQFELLDQRDEINVVACTRKNGEHVMFELPSDYTPASDGGETLFRAVCPELFGDDDE